MKFGLFDHLERSPDRPLATQFDERLEFVASADANGFYCLHVAEHHSSPLNMVPEPSVWLAAVATLTAALLVAIPNVYDRATAWVLGLMDGDFAAGFHDGPLALGSLEGLLDWVLEDPDRNEFDLLLDRVREVLERSAAEAVEPFEDEGL